MQDRRAALRARLLAIFRAEAGEHLRTVEALAQRWTGAPDPADAEDLFRTVHTLKGAARSVGRQDVEALCQELETELAKARRGDAHAGGRIATMLGPAVDRLRRAVLDLPGQAAAPTAPRFEPPEEAQSEPVSPEPSSPEPSLPEPSLPERSPSGPEAKSDLPGPTQATMRVEATGLDRLLQGVEELTGLRVALERRIAAMTEAIAAVAAGPATEGGRRQLEARLWNLRRALQDDRRGLESSLAVLADEARRLCTAPAWSVLEVLPPMLEDIARAQGKSVRLATDGFDLVLDRRVLDAVKDPLIHIARNAVDHGVETPDERRAAGKNPTAAIRVAIARRDERRIAVSVADDGRGIDLERVRAAASRLRLLPAAELAAMPPDRLRELVFRSGLSTSATVTALSGHGLGLAIARDRVEAIGGHVELRSDPGAGSQVTLVVPTVIASFRGLLVRVGGESLLLPMDAVAGVVRRPAGEQWQTGMGCTLSWRNQAVPMAYMSRVLGMEDGVVGSAFCAVVVEAGGERGALVVDAVEGEHSLLLKPLPSPLARVRNVSAAVMLADGELALVLRPADLLRSMHADRGRVHEPEPVRRAPPRVLIVDDSVTTRLMEQNLFEAAGYDVRLAADGGEALALIRAERFDVVVSDVDMPVMDGFELTRRIRAEPSLADLPVVLVTALESREDKEAGLRAGANAYVTKSDFDQSRLLEIVGRMT